MLSAIDYAYYRNEANLIANSNIQFAIEGDNRITSYNVCYTKLLRSKYRYPGIPQMNLHLIENSMFRIKSVDVLPIRGYHYKLPVFGYRIGNMAYLTDMNSLDTEEKAKLSGLDVLIVNALRIEKHMSYNFV